MTSCQSMAMYRLDAKHSHYAAIVKLQEVAMFKMCLMDLLQSLQKDDQYCSSSYEDVHGTA